MTGIAGNAAHFKNIRQMAARRTFVLLLSHALVGVRGNVHTSSIAHWKSHGRLPIRDNRTFSLALTAEQKYVEIDFC